LQHEFLYVQTRLTPPEQVSQNATLEKPMNDFSSRQLLTARRRFFDDGAAPRGLVPEAILRSWQRCAGLGLSESAAPDFQPLTAQALRHVCEKHESLRHLCIPELRALYADAHATGSIVILTAPDGLILETLGSAHFLDKASRVALRPGVHWSEATTGTNAIGTAMIEGRATEVRGSEHYFQPHRVLSCSAVPIIDPFGKIAGVMDLSGEASVHHVHALGMVRLAVDQIEHRLFEREFPGCVVMRAHRDSSLLGSVREGIFVFDGERLVAANRHALSLLGLVRGDLGRHRFEELFDAQLTDIERKTALIDAKGHALSIKLDVPAAQRLPMRPKAPASASALGPRRLEPIFDAALERELERAQRILKAGMPVLLQGETGTGKEVFARELYRRYATPGAPFIAVNCAGLPDSLIESELFGYEEGAFTGARRRGATGLLRAADGGILFLDEIGDMPLALQSRLLRVLQEREVTPLGGGKPVKVDFALVSATHRDLDAAVARDDFRSDLFFRLAQYVVQLPTLRMHPDRRSLIQRIWSSVTSGLSIRMDADILSALCAYDWPGNLRQLTTTLRTLTALAGDGGKVERSDLPDAIFNYNEAAPHNVTRAIVQTTLAGITDQAIRVAIDSSAGNMAAAARKLGISRSTLYRRIS
jgi:sigma-54 dependent transcriptional regulator, acetoin dehydrogenase operon transcriptional activator AcoR